MIFLISLALTLCIGYADALAVTTSKPTSTQPVAHAHRADVPTLRLRPNEQYFPTQALHPQPSGTSLMIYPTGIYDEFPVEGVIVALGPELCDKIKDTASKSCNSQGLTQECQDALVATLPQTELSAHTKRFTLFAAAGLMAGLALILGLIFETNRIQTTGKAVPVNIKLSPGEIAQANSMVAAGTFAAVMAGSSPAPVTMTVPSAPTQTWPDSIVIETLSADKDDHKAGDVVYHIPKDAAGRISDFLAMTGIKETQEICKGQNVKRVDALEQCVQHIRRHAIDLADVGPANFLQIAQQNIPARPAAGQAIALPIENLAREGVALILPVYRVRFEHAPRRPNFDMGWDPLVLATSAAAVTIAAHAAMFVGESLLDIWIPRDRIINDLGEDKLLCPQDLLCVVDECQGQEKGDMNNRDKDPYCKKATNFGCKCSLINYGYAYEVEPDYMDKQYEWLEELIKKSTRPDVKPACIDYEVPWDDAAKNMQSRIEEICANHEDLKSDFADPETAPKEGFELTLRWTKKEGDCPFECASLFSIFAESESCMKDNKIRQTGQIDTECGTAKFFATPHNGS